MYTIIYGYTQIEVIYAKLFMHFLMFKYAMLKLYVYIYNIMCIYVHIKFNCNILYK